MKACFACVVVLGLSLIGPRGVSAQTTQAAQRPQGPPAKPDPADPADSKLPTPEALGVSLDRVKFALEQTQPPQITIEPNAPTFRIQVIERRKFILPEFAEGLKIGWAPVPSGGLDYYEFMKMVTPPQAQPFGAFSSSQLPQIMATSLVASLMLYGLQKAGGYLHEASVNHEAEQMREDVKRELIQYLLAHPELPRPAWWTSDIR